MLRLRLTTKKVSIFHHSLLWDSDYGRAVFLQCTTSMCFPPQKTLKKKRNNFGVPKCYICYVSKMNTSECVLLPPYSLNVYNCRFIHDFLRVLNGHIHPITHPSTEEKKTCFLSSSSNMSLLCVFRVKWRMLNQV